MDMGESLVASYLHHVEKCSIISKNVFLGDEQGEVDVVGLAASRESGMKPRVFLCESSVHLGGGGFHGKEVERVTAKAERALALADRLFPSDTYDRVFEFWAANFAANKVIKASEGLASLCGSDGFISAAMVANTDFTLRVETLKSFARDGISPTNEPAFRMLQILEHLK